MKQKVIISFFLGFFILGQAISHAQMLVIHFKDGTSVTALLKRIQNLGFSEASLLEQYKSGAVSTYALSSIRKLTFEDQPAAITQSIPLTSGWNSLSSYILPDVPELTALLESISSELIIIQNLEAVYYPEGGIQSLENWDSQSAFSVKVSEDCSIPVTGQPEDNKTIQLEPGWNLIAVISNQEVNTETLFSPLGSNLKMIMEVTSTSVYWPEFSINTLETLQPGKAYLVNVTEAATITFPN